MEHELVGYIAALVTTLSFIPQALKTLKGAIGEPELSVVSYLAFGVGLSLWIVYGALISSFPIIIANSVTLVIIVIIIARSVQIKKNDSEDADEPPN